MVAAGPQTGPQTGRRPSSAAAGEKSEQRMGKGTGKGTGKGKQIYVTSKTHARLRLVAFERGLSMQDMADMFIEQGLDGLDG